MVVRGIDPMGTLHSGGDAEQALNLERSHLQTVYISNTTGTRDHTTGRNPECPAFAGALVHR